MLWQTLLLGLLQAAAADESIALVEGKVDLEVDLDGDLEDLGLPKRCNKKKGSKTCCLCGRVSDHNSREELSDIKFLHGWNPELCEEGENTKRVCCPRWATDCKETDPYFSVRLMRDCGPDTDTCLDFECSAVTKELHKAQKELDVLRKGKQVEENWKETVITGESNNFWGGGCDCACGKIVNMTTYACESLNKNAWFCPDVRPCCTKLEDCKPEAPWRKTVEESAQRAKEQSDDFTDAERVARSRMVHLERLTQDCVMNCVVARTSQCVADLKSVAKKKTFGKDRTWQDVIEKERYKKSHVINTSPAWVAQYVKLEDERNPERAKHQLVEMKRILPLSKKRTCCACGHPLHDEKLGFLPLQGIYPKVTKFCLLHEQVPKRIGCKAYQGMKDQYGREKDACKETRPEFCGDPSVPLCPSNQGAEDHFLTATTWEEATT